VLASSTADRQHGSAALRTILGGLRQLVQLLHHLVPTRARSSCKAKIIHACSCADINRNYFPSSRTGLSSHYRTLGPSLDPLLFFSNLRTEEHRLRQAEALLLMRRTCNL
jgi:hypothetical protein